MALPDLCSGVLLDEVNAGDGDLGLVGPCAAELALSSGQDGARLGIDEQLGDVRRRGEPFGVVGADGVDIGGLSADRDLPWPHQHREAILAGCRERSAVLVHLLVAQLSQHRGGQDALDEHVALEDHLLTGSRAQALEDRARDLRPVLPARDRPDDRLHVGDRANAVGVTPGPVEAERAAPVVQHEDDVLGGAEGFQQPVEELAVAHERVSLLVVRRELVRVAHADEIRGDAAPVADELGHGRAPQERRCRIAVQEHDRRPLAKLDVGHPAAEQRRRSAWISASQSVSSRPPIGSGTRWISRGPWDEATCAASRIFVTRFDAGAPEGARDRAPYVCAISSIACAARVSAEVSNRNGVALGTSWTGASSESEPAATFRA